MTDPAVSNGGYFSTGVVERMTGLSAHTLRAWERRYELRPSGRTASGQRAFSREDVERYQLLKRLLDQGFRIGQIARLEMEALQELLDTSLDVRSGAATPGHTGSNERPTVAVAVVGELLQALLAEAVRRHGWAVHGYSSVEALQACGDELRVDWLIAEMPRIDLDQVKRLLISARRLGPARLALTYRYATQHQVNGLRASGITLLSYPSRGEDPLEWLGEVVPAAPLPEGGEAPLRPPRFSRARLAAILRDSPVVECECPQHLARLVDSLVAFEQYSEQCQVDNVQDAALHARLCALAGRARMLMEQSLETVLEAEGVEI